jgi:hypothetical protein
MSHCITKQQRGRFIFVRAVSIMDSFDTNENSTVSDSDLHSMGEFDYRNRDSDPDRDPNRACLFTSSSDHGESSLKSCLKS